MDVKMKKVLLVLIIMLFLLSCSLSDSIIGINENNDQSNTSDDISRTQNPFLSTDSDMTNGSTSKTETSQEIEISKIGHLGKGIINIIAYSPEKNVIAVGTSTGIYIYEDESFKELKHLETEFSVFKLKFSNDGNQLVINLADQEIKILNLTSEFNLLTPNRQGDVNNNKSIFPLSFSPDDKLFAACYYNEASSELWLWNTETGDVKNILRNISCKEKSNFSKDYKIYATVKQKNIQLWDVTSGVLVETLEGGRAAVDVKTKITFSPDNKKLATGCYGNRIEIWDMTTKSLERELWDGTYIFNEITSISYSNDGSLIASGREDGSIQIWATKNGTLLKTIQGHRYDVLSVDFSKDDNAIISIGIDDSIRFSEVATGNLIRMLEFDDFTSPIDDIAILPDQESLVAVSEEVISIWDLRNFILLSDQPILNRDQEVYSRTYDRSVVSANGNKVAIPIGHHEVILWEVGRGELFSLDVLDNSICAFSHDGKFLATAGGINNVVQLWDTSSGTLLKTWKRHTDYVVGLAFSSDGSILASSSIDHTIKLWDIKNEVEIMTIIDEYNHNSAPFNDILIFTPDNKFLVSRAFFWKLYNSERISTLGRNKSYSTSYAISPDRKYLVVGYDDGNVQLYSIPKDLGKKNGFDSEKTVEENNFLIKHGIFKTHNLAITSIVFSKDSKTIILGSDDGTISLWEIH